MAETRKPDLLDGVRTWRLGGKDVVAKLGARNGSEIQFIFGGGNKRSVPYRALSSEDRSFVDAQFPVKRVSLDESWQYYNADCKTDPTTMSCHLRFWRPWQKMEASGALVLLKGFSELKMNPESDFFGFPILPPKGVVFFPSLLPPPR